MKSKAIITQNFWQELQDRGFLLDFYRVADRLAKEGDSLAQKDNGVYSLLDAKGEKVATFVTSAAFLGAIQQTEEIVKYRLFINQ